MLGAIGLARVLLMPTASVQTQQHELLLAVAVATSLVWIVLWGAVAGAMLPFLLRRLGFEPASASAPFVATLSDVTENRDLLQRRDAAALGDAALAPNRLTPPQIEWRMRR